MILLVTDTGNNPGFPMTGMRCIPAVTPDIPKADYAEGVFLFLQLNIRRYCFMYFRYQTLKDVRFHLHT